MRLPAAVIEALMLKEGDEIVVGARVFEIKKRPAAREVLARLRKFRGRWPADFKAQQLALFNGHYDSCCYLPVAGVIPFDRQPEQYLLTCVPCRGRLWWKPFHQQLNGGRRIEEPTRRV